MQYSSPEQNALIDRQAFQSLYQENIGPIYRFVYGKVGNREVAEDLTSQIFIKALRSLNYEYNLQSIHNWLFRVARTTIADYWRTFYRTASSSLDALVEMGWEGPAENKDGDTLLDLTHPRNLVRRILQDLSERDREVLTCRFLLGLSIRETAVRMGLTEGNVKTSQYRALKHAADLEYIANKTLFSDHY